MVAINQNRRGSQNPGWVMKAKKGVEDDTETDYPEKESRKRCVFS